MERKKSITRTPDAYGLHVAHWSMRVPGAREKDGAEEDARDRAIPPRHPETGDARLAG